MMNVRFNTYNQRVPNNQTAFKGFKGVDKLVRSLDFVDKNTTKNMSFLTVAGVVLSRLPFVRDKYELRETAFRDSLMLGSLFCVSASAEKFVAWSLEKLSKRADGAENIFLGPNTKKIPSFWEAVKPFGSRYSIRSFPEIEELGLNSKLRDSILKNKKLSFASGILLPVLLLGIAIPWLNTIWTKNDVKGQANAENNGQKQNDTRKSQQQIPMDQLFKIASQPAQNISSK